MRHPGAILSETICNNVQGHGLSLHARSATFAAGRDSEQLRLPVCRNVVSFAGMASLASQSTARSMPKGAWKVATGIHAR